MMFSSAFSNGRRGAVAIFAATVFIAATAKAQRLLVPMDDAQQNHLKAYGLTYNAIKAGASAEWLLNYRGGSFLLADTPELRRQAGLAGITIEALDNGKVSALRAEIAGANMEAVPLEKAPKVAVYTPPDALPWDDAVTIALKYAGIEYTPIYDDEVEKGDLSKYDWLHLHHEDFTGQLNKFYLSYRDAPWFIDLLQKNTAAAKRLGYANMPGLKKDVAEKIREFVERRELSAPSEQIVLQELRGLSQHANDEALKRYIHRAYKEAGAWASGEKSWRIGQLHLSMANSLTEIDSMLQRGDESPPQVVELLHQLLAKWKSELAAVSTP